MGEISRPSRPASFMLMSEIAQPMRSFWGHMSKANLAGRGVRHNSSVAFHFPYLTDPEQDELKRFRKIHIDSDQTVLQPA